ncbi:MAG: hypothetical protein Q4A19_04980 [Johnsonella sp.]|nr:hypothetical protein [Johnsonella sp.]
MQAEGAIVCKRKMKLNIIKIDKVKIACKEVIINLRKQMKQKLTNLALGELAAVAVIWMNFFLFREWIITAKSLISISFTVFILSFILIQGSVFWWIMIKRISKPKFAVKYTGKIYNILKILDLILLCMGACVILLNYSTFHIMMISFGIWIFAVIEWVNYYKLQLSYSLNPAILLKYILQKKLRKSKIAEEIDKANKKRDKHC